MGGKTGTTTQSVQIPPQVLQNYQLANNMMQTAAAQPFQTYNAPQGNPDAFVAPLNQQQYAGINTVNQAGNVAQPYFQAGTQSIMGAADTGAGYNQSATQQYLNAQNVGGQYAGQSLGALMGGNVAAAPMQAQAAQNIGGAFPGAQGYNQVAGGLYAGAMGAAQPLQSQAQRGIGQALAGAQPFNQMAAGMTAAGSQAVDPSQLNAGAINQYMSPYLQNVVGQTAALQNQQNQQAMAGQLGNAISQGAFGGDRAGIAAAALQGQQNLATGNLLSGLLNQGYGQALSTAQQQQQLGLGAQQANLARQMAGGQQLANIGQQGYAQGMGAAQQQAALGQQLYGQGLGAGQAFQGLGQQQYGQQLGAGQAQAGLGQQLFGQGAANSQQLAALGQQQYGQGAGTAQGLAGIGQQAYAQGTGTGTTLAGLGTQAQQNLLSAGQAQIGAGTLGQQTQQAGLSALYNQFLQQQGYPFQTAQAVANVAEGTGALSGSTTTTAQPIPFFSDERLKEDIEPIGKTFDGQNIVKFRYKNEPGTRIGLIAQDVEKHHPDAVGLAGGYRTVDYDKATEAAAKRGHFRKGGLVPQSEGGAVIPLRAGEGYADGGSPSVVGATDLAELLKAQAQALGLYGGAGGGLYGRPQGAGLGAMGYVPAPSGSVPHLVTAGDIPKPLPSGLTQGLDAAKSITDTYKGGKDMYRDIKSLFKDDGEKKKTEAQDQDLANTTGSQPGAVTKEPLPDITPPNTGTSQNTGASGNTDGDPEGNYRGGLVRRHRAAGGADDDPYNPVGPSIPGLDAAAKSDNAPTGLKTPGAPGQSGDGGVLGAAKGVLGAFQTGKGILDMGKDIMSVLPFLARGGVASRYGYEEGGDVSKDKEDDNPEKVSDESTKPDVEVPDKLPIPQVKSDQKLAVAPQAPPPMEPVFDSMTKGFENILQGIGAVLPKAYGGALTDHHIAHALRLAMGGTARHGYKEGGVPDEEGGVPDWDEVKDKIAQHESVGSGDYDAVYGGGKYGNPDRPLSEMSIGDVYDWQQNLRNNILSQGGPKTSAVGRYQDQADTLRDLAQNAYGEDWRKPKFDQGTQEYLNERLYNSVKTNPKRLAATWPTTFPVANAAPAQTAPVQPSPAQDVTVAQNNTPQPQLPTESVTVSENRLKGLQPAVLTDPAMIRAGLAPDNPQLRSIQDIRSNERPDVESGPYNKTERWLIPLLSGLGTMASSPSRFLGSALLQGIGGGAESYAAMQKGQFDAGQAQQRLGVQAGQAGLQIQGAQNTNMDQLLNLFMKSKALLPRNMTFEQFVQGYKNGTLAIPETAEGKGSGSADSTIPSPSVPTQYKYDAAELENAVIPYVVNGKIVRVPAKNDRNYVNNWRQHNAVTAAYSDADRANYTSATSTINSLPAGMTYDEHGNLIPQPSYWTAQSTAKYNSGLIDRTTNFLKAENDFLPQYERLTEQNRQLSDIYKNYRGGTASQAIAGLSGLVSMLDPDGQVGLVKALPKDWGIVDKNGNITNKDAYDTANKIVASQIAQQIDTGLSSGAPASAMALLQKAVANPALGAAARRELIVHTQAMLDQNRAMYLGYDRNKDNLDDYIRDFVSKHPYRETFVKGADKMFPQFAGAQPEASTAPVTSPAVQTLREKGNRSDIQSELDNRAKKNMRRVP